MIFKKIILFFKKRTQLQEMTDEFSTVDVGFLQEKGCRTQKSRTECGRTGIRRTEGCRTGYPQDLRL
jgi:hypothetical protein